MAPWLLLLCEIALAWDLCAGNTLASLTLDPESTSSSEGHSDDNITTPVSVVATRDNESDSCDLDITRMSKVDHFLDHLLPSEKPEFTCSCSSEDSGKLNNNNNSSECPVWNVPEDSDLWTSNTRSEWTGNVCRSYLTLEVTRNVTDHVALAFHCREQYYVVVFQSAGNHGRCKESSDCRVPGQICSESSDCLSQSCCTCPPDRPVYVEETDNHCYPEIVKNDTCELVITEKSNATNSPSFYLPSEKAEFECGCSSGNNNNSECPAWRLTTGHDLWTPDIHSERTDNVCRSLLTLKVTPNVTQSLRYVFGCRTSHSEQISVVVFQLAEDGQGCRENSDCGVPGQTCSATSGRCSCPPDKPIYLRDTDDHCYPEAGPGDPCVSDHQCTGGNSFCTALNSVPVCRCRKGFSPSGGRCVRPPLVQPTDAQSSARTSDHYFIVAGGVFVGILVGTAIVIAFGKARCYSGRRRGSQRALVVDGEDKLDYSCCDLTTDQRQFSTSGKTVPANHGPAPFQSATFDPGFNIHQTKRC